MAVRRIINMGHPTLREVAAPIAQNDIGSSALNELVKDMIETLADYGGIGLAAPQINESIRLAILDVPTDTRYTIGGPSLPLTVCINPKITVLSDTTAGYWEGCLSVPGLRGWVERPQHIRLEYTDLDGRRHTHEIEGFLATVCQHEFDHLDGILYVDRMDDPTKLYFDDEFTRFVDLDSANHLES